MPENKVFGQAEGGFYSSFNTFWMTDGYSADIIAYEIMSML